MGDGDEQQVVRHRRRHHDQKSPEHRHVKLPDAGLDHHAGGGDIQHHVGAAFDSRLIEQPEFLTADPCKNEYK